MLLLNWFLASHLLFTIGMVDRNRHGGGVALYIRNTINYECLLNHDSQINLEWIAVKVITPNAKPFIAGTWYQPPGCGIEILNAFVTLLQHLEPMIWKPIS